MQEAGGRKDVVRLAIRPRVPLLPFEEARVYRNDGRIFLRRVGDVLRVAERGLGVDALEDARGYGTKDLFTKHPTKNLWKL